MRTLREKMDQMYLKLNCGHRKKISLVKQPMERRRQQIMGGA